MNGIDKLHQIKHLVHSDQNWILSVAFYLFSFLFFSFLSHLFQIYSSIECMYLIAGRYNRNDTGIDQGFNKIIDITFQFILGFGLSDKFVDSIENSIKIPFGIH